MLLGRLQLELVGGALTFVLPRHVAAQLLLVLEHLGTVLALELQQLVNLSVDVNDDGRVSWSVLHDSVNVIICSVVMLLDLKDLLDLRLHGHL